MFKLDYDGEYFYKYAMELFSRAGHVFTSFPEFVNHSPEQFVFFDNKSDIVLSRDQRMLFRVFNNVSRLFTANSCAFFSINLLTAPKGRSQVAHDIHTLIHPIIGAEGTICLFRYNTEVMISFLGFGYRCILSDWYSMDDDFDNLLERLDIANMSIRREADYFSDMIFSLARYYYLHDQPTTFELLPVDFVSSAGLDGVDRDEIDRQIEYELASPQHNYEDEYVEYDESNKSAVSKRESSRTPHRIAFAQMTQTFSCPKPPPCSQISSAFTPPVPFALSSLCHANQAPTSRLPLLRKNSPTSCTPRVQAIGQHAPHKTGQLSRQGRHRHVRA